jgi:hypothetical protein
MRLRSSGGGGGVARRRHVVALLERGEQRVEAGQLAKVIGDLRVADRHALVRLVQTNAHIANVVVVAHLGVDGVERALLVAVGIVARTMSLIERLARIGDASERLEHAATRVAIDLSEQNRRGVLEQRHDLVGRLGSGGPIATRQNRLHHSRQRSAPTVDALFRVFRAPPLPPRRRQSA